MGWELKLLVASLFATSASFGPFFTLFMQDKGFDALQIGSMISFSRVVMLLSTPAACAYADRRGVHRGLLATLALTAAAIILMFPFAPRGDVVIVGLIFALYSMCCGSKLAICDTIVLHACNGKADRYPLQRLWGSIAWGVTAMVIGFFLKLYHKQRVEQGQMVTYELVPVIHAFFQVCFATVLLLVIRPTTGGPSSSSSPPPSNDATSVTPPATAANSSCAVEEDDEALIDANAAEATISRGNVTVDVAGPLGSVTSGGTAPHVVKQRCRSFQGAGVATTAPQSPVPPVQGSHHHYGGGGSAAVLTSAAAPSSSSSTIAAGSLSLSSAAATSFGFAAALRGYARLARDRRVLFPVVFGVSLLALSEVAMNNFLFPYLRRALKAPPELFSYVLMIHSVSEVAAFTGGSQLVALIGPRYMLMLSAAAFFTKAMWYSFLVNPWSLLYVETLHGVCFAIMWTAAVAHVSKVAETFSAMSAQLASSSADSLPASAALSSCGVPVQHHHHQSSPGSSSGQRAHDKATLNVRSSSMAMTTLWFFANGLPSVVGGVFSGYVVYHAETQEVALFQILAGLAAFVAILFWVYGDCGCFENSASSSSLQQGSISNSGGEA